MSQILKDIETGLKIFDSFLRFKNILKTKAKHYFSEPIRIEKITDDYFSSKLDVGSVITTKGLLTRYGFNYRPRTYITTIPMFLSDQSTGKKIEIENKKYEYRLLNAIYKPFQFPIQSLPKIEADTGKFKICYLYPSTTNSFILDEDKNKYSQGQKILLDDHLKITSQHQGIPVLLNENDIEKLCEKIVKITGIVTDIPDDILDNLMTSLCKTRRDFYYSFLRPTAPRTGFCIDCRDNINSDFTIKSPIKSLLGAVYLESHFNNLNIDNFETELRNAIPNYIDIRMKYKTYPDIIHYNTNNEINLMYHRNGVYGFYIETDLVDQIKFDISLKKLQAFYSFFATNSQKIIQDKFDLQSDLKLDFLFDYKRQKLFDHNGVLLSAEISQILEKNHGFDDTIKWLSA